MHQRQATLLQPYQCHARDGRAGCQAQQRACDRFARNSGRQRTQAGTAAVQHLQRQADRLNADAFGQSQHHGDKRRQAYDPGQFRFEQTGQKGGHDAAGQVAQQPREAGFERSNR